MQRLKEKEKMFSKRKDKKEKDKLHNSDDAK